MQMLIIKLDASKLPKTADVNASYIKPKEYMLEIIEKAKELAKTDKVVLPGKINCGGCILVSEEQHFKFKHDLVGDYLIDALDIMGHTAIKLKK